MMKDIKELVTPIAERIKNPFFGSVAISWLIVNWRILVALFGYSKKDLETVGASSYIPFIEMQGSWKLIWCPILLGALYTVAVPVIKMLNSALVVLFNRYSSRWNRELSEGSYIPIKRHLNFLAENEKLREEYMKLINSESELAEMKTVLANERRQLKLEQSKLIEDRLAERLQKVRLRPGGKFHMAIRGRTGVIWENKVLIGGNGADVSFEAGSKRVSLFHISRMAVDTESRAVLLHCLPSAFSEAHVVPFLAFPFWIELKYAEDLTGLAGLVNGSSYEITFQKLNPHEFMPSAVIDAGSAPEKH